MQYNILLSLFILCLLSLLSYLVSGRRHNPNVDCDFNYRLKCMEDDDPQCPVKCKCAPYPFTRRITQCEKYCIFFAERPECLKACEETDAITQQSDSKINHEKSISSSKQNPETQNSKKEENHKDNFDDGKRHPIFESVKIKTLVDKWERFKEETRQLIETNGQINKVEDLFKQFKSAQSEAQVNSECNMQCIAQCYQHYADDQQLTDCIVNNCCPKAEIKPFEGISLAQQNQENVDSNSDSLIDQQSSPLSFIITSLTALAICGVITLVLGFIGLKVFQKWQNKNALEENLLHGDYLSLNDDLSSNILNAKTKQGYQKAGKSYSGRLYSSIMNKNMSGSFGVIREDENEYKDDEGHYKKLH